MSLTDPAPRLERVSLDQVDESEVQGLKSEVLRLVLLLRKGFNHTQEHTHEEIGETLSVSKERVRQLEQVALAEIRIGREEAIGLRSDAPLNSADAGAT